MGTRTRLQRYRDAKIFHGWVEAFTGTTIDVATSTESPLEVGDCFHVEAFGHAVSSTFTAEVDSIRPFDMMYGGQVRSIGNNAIRLIEATRATVRLEITSVIRYSSGLEAVRVRVEDLPATITFKEEDYQVRVVDVSPTGIGLLTAEAWEPGDSLAVQMLTPFGDIAAECKVRYCRKDPGGSTERRIGVQFSVIDRINDQRWQRFLKEFV